MPPRADYPPLQFAGFRVALGAYLAVYFASISFYAGELLSAEGMVPDVSMNLSQKPFPDVLVVAQTPAAATAFAVLATAVAVLFTVGLFRRPAAAILWYAIACVAHRNSLFPDPSTPFTGWLLLATLFVPTGEPLTVTNRSLAAVSGWRFPRAVFVATWIMLGVSYSVSGLIKLKTPEWTDGRAFGLFLDNALHRDSIVWSTMRALPATLLTFATWQGLATELLAAPLALTRWTRPVAFLALAAMHLTILGVMRTTLLSLGALLPLILAFDAGWLDVLRRAHRSPPGAERTSAAKARPVPGGARRNRQRAGAGGGDRRRRR